MLAPDYASPVDKYLPTVGTDMPRSMKPCRKVMKLTSTSDCKGAFRLFHDLNVEERTGELLLKRS